MPALESFGKKCAWQYVKIKGEKHLNNYLLSILQVSWKHLEVGEDISLFESIANKCI